MNRSVLFLAMFSSFATFADTSVATSDNAVIDNSGQQYKGSIMVNQAAGDQQQQINSRAIAIGTNASASTSLTQKINTGASTAINAKAAIQGNSFSNGTGMVGVNQSAGANNQMINAVRLSISAAPQSVDDSALSQQNVALLPNSGSPSTQGSRQVVTSDQAFTGSRGVIQVNQSAGVGNRMANTLSIRVAD
ncbi:adhesin [Pseudomonas gingeri]|uniref:adhesin n=1 Tax=Pseudomonas gingeri TaxID=117681 RepID=UPI00159F7E60|nr:adhesin [Pseudomonas gingeri]NWE45085.1 adhesin [Pseudomonas gingeri]